MCAIAGIVGGQDNEQLVARMLVAQAHRGPNGSGIWIGQGAGGTQLVLGHRRLAIIDLSPAGAQPMVDAGGHFTLTYNGEIYNYIEIRAELRRLGARFRTESDSEVILEAYRQWGVGCLSRFNGMFAFALYDSVRNVVFCARDRYGEKPFLFAFGDRFFAFASEYKALLLHPDLSLDIDEWRLLRAAHEPGTGLDADRETAFRSVRQLLPGEAMEVDVASLACRHWRYWTVEPGLPHRFGDEREVFDEFKDLLTDSVRLRLRSDVPVGSCLSGGLDSASIVCIVRGILGSQAEYNAFTGRFPGTYADEWPYAARVVEATRVVSHVVEPTVERFVDELPQFVWMNELPVGSSSQFAQWCVFDLARRAGVTVLLDGQGADELLGGYEQYFVPYLRSLRGAELHARRRRELSAIHQRYPGAIAPGLRRIRDRIPLRARHWLASSVGGGSSLLYGMRSDVAQRLDSESMLPTRPGFHGLASALLHDSFGRSLTTLLRYGDRNSMAHSREVRLPFCDHRIAEFVLRLPPHLIMGEAQTKRLLRESMRGVLPEAIRTRWRKQGFRPPQESWFRSPPFLALVETTLESAFQRPGAPWIPRWWSSAVRRVRSGEGALGWVLWQPFMIEQWRQHFVGRVEAMRRQCGSGDA